MIDFKTAKKIVLALKKIAANISSDKSNSNTNTNTDTNTNTNTNDDNLNYVIFNDVTLGYGNFLSSMFFTLENNDPDDNTLNVYAGNEGTLGELFASDTLIKLFNKAIEHIEYMIDKGYSSGKVNMVYNINNITDESYVIHGNLNSLSNTIVLSDLVVEFDGSEQYTISFKDKNDINSEIAYAVATTKFDETTSITSRNGGGGSSVIK